MNILIVGNGFDLSHYLPTKYDHFMVAMDAIENWDESKGDMTFDDLFCKDYWYKNKETGEEYQNVFFQYTKAMYDTDAIKIPLTQVRELKKQLKENVWYQYFSDHVREVKTWIDFETKIKSALEVVFDFYNQVLKAKSQSDNFVKGISTFTENSISQGLILRCESSIVLKLMNILNIKHFKNTVNTSGLSQPKEVSDSDTWDFFRFYLNENYIYKSKYYEDYNFHKVLTHLQLNLDNFIGLFNTYLMLVEKLEAKLDLKKNGELNFLNEIDQIYSFNYTDTFNKKYGEKKCDFLHGKVGLNQNIVMGVSDLDEQFLSNFNLYGFTKYHQKISKGTDFKFLFDYISENKKHILSLTEAKSLYLSSMTIAELRENYSKHIKNIEKKT